MIVTCPECSTRFNLDESRLRGDSAKVRCSKCKHTFMIQRDAEPPQQEFSIEFDATKPAPLPPIPPAKGIGPGEEQDSSNISFDHLDFPDTDGSGQAISPSFMKTTPPPAEDFISFADVSLPDDFQKQSASEHTEDEGFDFMSFDTESTSDSAISSQSKPEALPPPEMSDFEIPPTADVQTTQDENQQSIEDNFASYPERTWHEAAETASTPSILHEYRPLLIAGASTLLITIALTAGYFIFKGKPGDLERLGIQNISTSADEEKGGFTISSTDGFYVTNKHDGKLFVVKAKAVNNYKSPRMGVEAQVTIFDRAGKPLTNAQAFCNSGITEKDLIELPFDDLTARLSAVPSQDPLESTPVEPNKSTECIIVFKNLPQEASDFGVEIIHSQSEELNDL